MSQPSSSALPAIISTILKMNAQCRPLNKKDLLIKPTAEKYHFCVFERTSVEMWLLYSSISASPSAQSKRSLFPRASQYREEQLREGVLELGGGAGAESHCIMGTQIT